MTNELKQFLLEEGFTEQELHSKKDVNWYEFTDLMEKLINANKNNEKKHAEKWYLHGFHDSETTESQNVSLTQTMKDAECHFHFVYEHEMKK